MTVAIVRVPFAGDELQVFEREGKRFVVLKPVVDTLGLGYSSLVRTLKSKSWATLTMVVTVGADGKNREMLAVDVRTLLMLLATIDESRVAEAARPKLVAYQAHVADVIDDYFTRGAALNPAATLEQKRATASLAVQRWVAEELEDHPALWNGPLVEALARLWRVRPKVEQAGGFPVGLLRAVQRVYRVVLGDDLYEAMRKKSGFGDDRDKRYNALREDGYLRLSRELGKVEILAQTSQSKREFKAKLESYFAGRPLQADLGWA